MAIVIDLDIGGPKSNSTLQRLEEKLTRLEQVSTALIRSNMMIAASAGKAATAYRQMSSQANQAANSAGRATRAIRGPRAFDPNGITNPQAILRQYGQAALQGDPSAIRWVLAANTAQNRQNRVNRILAPPQQGGNLARALARTRFNASGQGFPLGVDIQSLLSSGNMAGLAQLFGRGGAAAASAGGAGAAGSLAGAAAAGGPITLAIGAAIAAVMALVAVMKLGFSALTATLKSVVSGGGSANQAYVANRLSGFTGTSASGLFGNIAGGGQAAAIAAGLGVSPVRGMFGETNDNRDFIKIARAISNMAPDQARRTAIGLGSPELAKLAYLSKNAKNRLFKSMDTQMSQSDLQTIADFQANIQVLWSKIKEVGMRFVMPLMKLFNLLFDIGDRINSIVEGVKERVGFKPGSKRNDALDRNTRAVEENTRTIRDGTYGGGERARNARPRDLRHREFDNARINRDLRLSPI